MPTLVAKLWHGPKGPGPLYSWTMLIKKSSPNNKVAIICGLVCLRGMGERADIRGSSVLLANEYQTTQTEASRKGKKTI